MELTKGKLEGQPERVVIYGPEGVGKTELAARFPAPVFMDTENSTSHIDCVRTPVPTSFAHAMQMIGELRQDPQGMQTLVIDTVDWLERLAVAEVCAERKVDGIEGIGYGKGYVYLAEKMGRLLDALRDLGKATGMHVVLTAHACTKKFELPEEAGAYDRWAMKLSKHFEPVIREWASMVLFLSYKTMVDVTRSAEGKETKAKACGSMRVIRTQKEATWDAKNRHGLKAEIPAEIINGRHEGWDALKHLFPAQTCAASLIARAAPEPSAPAPAAPATPAAPPHTSKLMSIMAESGVTYDQVLEQIVARGYFPAGTAITTLPKEFVEGRLLPNWQMILDLINSSKKEA